MREAGGGEGAWKAPLKGQRDSGDLRAVTKNGEREDK